VKTAPSFVGVTIDEANPSNGTELLTFYREKNQRVMVEVVLDNPDDLEIRHIWINNYAYTNFESNSTNDHIYFELDPGSDLGLKQYSVDDIDYFDGADTRQVTVSQANNAFNIYVFKDVPTVERENYSLTQDTINIDFNITDHDDVIEDGSLIVELYVGDNLETTQELQVGYQSVSFSNLYTNRTYDVIVKADYDIDDSTGSKSEVTLFSGTFTTLPTTPPSATVSNIRIGSDEITFDVDYNDVDSVTSVGGLRVQLYRGETFVEEVILTGSTEDITFDNLFNSTEYDIQIITDYNLRDGLGIQTDYTVAATSVTTLSRSVPVPQIDNIYVEENRILFNVIIDDDEVSPIIFIDTLEARVYLEGESTPLRVVQISEDVVDIQIYDVLAGNQVYIELVADYDLNDGNGRQYEQVIHTIEYETLLNSRPEVYVSDITVTQGYVTVDLTVSDINNTLKSSLTAILYENEVEVQTVTFGPDTLQFAFAHLVEYESNYRVEILADYNLRDGQGTLDDEVLYTHTLSSLVPKAPAAEILNISTTTEGFAFDVLVMDADSTVLENSLFVHIYKNGVLVDTRSLTTGVNSFVYNDTFNTATTILSDTSYQIVVVGDYDVNDNNGAQLNQTLVEGQVVTKAKVVPTVVMTNGETDVDTITLDIFVTDLDDVIEPGSLIATLYQDGIQVGLPVPLVVGDNFNVTFDDVMSDTLYKVVVTTDYDLDNSLGIVTALELGFLELRTDAKQAPTAFIQNVEAFTETITLDVIVSDPDGVIVDGTTKAVLYVGNNPTGDEVVLSPGLNPAVTFNNVYSNQQFYIRIITDYDLGDGINVFTDQMLAYDFAETSHNQVMSGNIYYVTEGIDTITFNAIVTDPDNVITNNLKAILLLNNIPTGDEISLVVGDNQNKQFTNLNSDSEYTIRLVTDYDLRDINGEVTSFLLDSYTTSTDDYSAPTALINSVSATLDSINFNVTVTDLDNTATGDFKAVLYKEGVATGDEVILNPGLNLNISFENLFSGVPYEIIVVSTYDLNDGFGDQVDQEISSTVVSTLARKAPVGTASNISITDEYIHFNYDVTDEDGTLVPGTLQAWLYDASGETPALISMKNLYLNDVTFDISFLIANYPIAVCITADFDLSDGNGVINGEIFCEEFTTRANVTPSVIVSAIVINQETVEAKFNVSDDDEVIVGDLKAQLFDSNHVLIDTVILGVGVTNASFNATLNSGELYNIIVTADNNFRDGGGLIDDDILSENVIMAYNRLIPQAHVYGVETTVDSLTFDVVILDNDNTFVGNALALLYKDGVYTGQSSVLSIGTNLDVTFGSLVSDADYDVVIIIDYNNGDGNGDYLAAELDTETIHVLAKQAPTSSTSNDVVTGDSITLDITVVDTDSVITGNLKAVLYKDGLPTGDEVALVVGLNEGVSFTGLNSQTEYEIIVVTDYDLDDGVTVLSGKTLVFDTNTTLSNDVPTAIFTDVTSDTSSITFSAFITDDDSVITANTKAVLYRNGIMTGDEFVLSVGANNNLVFSNLLSNSQYTIILRTDYDLLDGSGEVLSHSIANTVISTLANEFPSALIGNASVTYDSITFDAIITDDDSVITGNLQAVLYSDGLPTGDVISLSVGSNLSQSFTGIYSNRLYEIKIETDFDLYDGVTSDTGYELTTLSRTTNSKATPNAVITNQVITNTDITFDVEVLDPSSAIVGTATAVLYKDGVATGDTVSLSLGDNVGVTFTGLEFGDEYVIQIETDYNNNIGNPDIEDYAMSTYTFSTFDIVTLENIVLNVDDSNFDIVLNDQFGILVDDDIILNLYDEGDNLVGDYIINGSGSVDILNFYNNHTYHLKVYVNVTGELNPVLVYEHDFNTVEKVIQGISIGEIGINGTQISTSIVTVLPDPDGVINQATIEAVLYENIGGVWTQIDQVALVNGTNSVIFNGVDGTDGTQYMIRVESTVNFNDGTGDIADYIIETRSFIYTTQI
jgi:hypothetical protein